MFSVLQEKCLVMLMECRGPWMVVDPEMKGHILQFLFWQGSVPGGGKFRYNKKLAEVDVLFICKERGLVEDGSSIGI